ncbi:MAG: hypothetical protein GY755_12890 [Chloroflexi bacterium]|nr:hypothetical protein [Chloroflexota bacterium]
MTALKKITPKFIESLLKKWQKGDFSADDLKTLGFLPSEEKTLEQQQLSLREMLYQHIQENLPTPVVEAVSSQNQERALHQLAKLFQSAPSNAQYYSLIYFRYLALQKYRVKELAKSIGVSNRTLRRYLLKAFELLSLQLKSTPKKDLSFFSEKEFKNHFPSLAENQAVGLEKILTTINNWLEEKDSHYAISIEGIGGIGKTLIAKHLAEKVYTKRNFEGYAWISARQTELSALGKITPTNNFANTLDDVVTRLAQQLKQNHLAGLSTQNKLEGLKRLTQKKNLFIIIDNLERVEDVDTLVPALLKLVKPSKLLFTSRKSLQHYPGLYTFRTPELSLENSRTLVMGELNRCGLSLSLSDEIISDLYQITGGIPLALKLATAQFGDIPANEIIQLLREGKESAQNMYIYIYRQAWLLLDDIGKNLLIAMHNISPDGEDRDWICDMNGLSEAEFAKGLQQLKRLSLIEFSGSIERPLYRIHRLTTTFLESDILKGWEDKEV